LPYVLHPMWLHRIQVEKTKMPILAVSGATGMMPPPRDAATAIEEHLQPLSGPVPATQ